MCDRARQVCPGRHPDRTTPRAFSAPLRVARCRHDGVADEVADYAAASAAGLLEDVADSDMDASAVAAELQDALGPLLEGALDDDAVAALCTQVACAFKGLNGDAPATGEEAAGSGVGGGGDAASGLLVNCDSIILAYAGKALLRASTLRLERGRRYGLCGQNGVGKSTLLARLCTGDIAGFPSDVKVEFVRQDTAFEDEQASVWQVRKRRCRASIPPLLLPPCSPPDAVCGSAWPRLISAARPTRRCARFCATWALHPRRSDRRCGVCQGGGA